MNMTTLLILGLSAGIAANFLDPRKEGGVIGPVFLGVLGSIAGALLGNMVLTSLGIESFPLQSFIVPSLGSLGVLLLARIFRSDTEFKQMKFKLPKEVREAWF